MYKIEKKDKVYMYLIHDNGGRPYKVKISGVFCNVVRIYLRICYNREKDQIMYGANPVLTFAGRKIFIGKNPNGSILDDGNTILVKMRNNKYVYIGADIFEFSSLDEIIKYVSPIWNSDVPYPYAVDRSGNIYLMNESVILVSPRGTSVSLSPRLLFNQSEKHILSNHRDPYDYYYSHLLITEDIGTVPPRQPKIKNFDDIKKFYIGKDRYTMRYTPFAESEYDRLKMIDKSLEDHPNGSRQKRNKQKLYVVTTNNRKKRLSKLAYLDLMQRFSNEMPFKTLPMSKLSLLRGT